MAAHSADYVRQMDWVEHWRAKFFEVQAHHQELEQAAYNYLTAPTKRTLKELWSALHIDGSGTLRSGQEQSDG